MIEKDNAILVEKKAGINIFPLSGDGRVIIGTLAAAGLRMTGNDGQFRGKLKIGTGEGHIVKVKEIIAALCGTG